MKQIPWELFQLIFKLNKTSKIVWSLLLVVFILSLKHEVFLAYFIAFLFSDFKHEKCVECLYTINMLVKHLVKRYCMCFYLFFILIKGVYEPKTPYNVNFKLFSRLFKHEKITKWDWCFHACKSIWKII